MEFYTKDYGILKPGDAIKLEDNFFCLNINAYLMVPKDLLMIQEENIYGFDGMVWDEDSRVIGYYYK